MRGIAGDNGEPAGQARIDRLFFCHHAPSPGPRVHLPSIPLHIGQRGHKRKVCFFSENDFPCYQHWLGEALKLR